MAVDDSDPAALVAALADSAVLLRLSAIAKRYANGTAALDRFDLDVGARECVGIVGPSGCGKSTALRLIAGLDRPTLGSMVWSEARSPSLGFVFQEPALLPWATAADNVYLPLRLQGVRRAQAEPKIAAALEGVGLQSFAAAYPRQLSGGMRMRVSLARALVTRPQLLLMDEPFAALDEMTRSRLNDDLLALAARQRLAIVFVTHSVYEAVYLCDRVLVMTPGPGRIAASIAIDEPRPRGEAFRNSGRYGALCAQVSQALRSAVSDGAS